MMNRLISIILVLAATISFSISIFADTVTTVPANDSTLIKATYNAAEDPEIETIFSVDIAWGSLEYTYDVKDKKTWNPSNLAYDTEDGFGTERWICDEGADTITVTNHSNTDITATFAYSPNNSYTNITGSFNGTDDNVISLKAPDEGSSSNDAPSGSAQLVLDGSFSGETANTQIGSVTLTIARKPEESGAKIVGNIVGTEYYFYETSSGVYETQTIDPQNLESSISLSNGIIINGTTYYIASYLQNGIDYRFTGTRSQEIALSTDNSESLSLTIYNSSPKIKLTFDFTKNPNILTVYNESFS